MTNTFFLKSTPLINKAFSFFSHLLMYFIYSLPHPPPRPCSGIGLHRRCCCSRAWRQVIGGWVLSRAGLCRRGPGSVPVSAGWHGWCRSGSLAQREWALYVAVVLPAHVLEVDVEVANQIKLYLSHAPNAVKCLFISP